jgi:5-formyltetrahydrofolate cyclo-ligase
MGGGYYDRALRHRISGGAWRRPRIVGVAFACQETDRLTAAPWDVPLDLIVTERGVLRPGSRRAPRGGGPA